MRATVAYAMNRSNRMPISAKGSCLARSEMTAERNLFTESRVEAENDVREDSLACRFKRLMRETSSLSPHPAIVRMQLRPKEAHVLKLKSIGPSIFGQPLLITKGGIIVDGHARWMAAKELGLKEIPCLEVDLSRDETLARIISEVSKSNWLVRFVRVELALPLADRLREKGRLNQKLGGHQKGLSNLTEAERVNTRDEVEHMAGVGAGTVTKVQQILSNKMASQVVQALRLGEVSIHFAWKLRKLSHSDQIDAITAKRIKRESRQTLVRLAKGKAPISSSLRESLRLIASGLKTLPGVPVTKRALDGINACLLFLNEHPESLREDSYEQKVFNQADSR